MSVKEVTEQVPNFDLLHESNVEEYEIWTPPLWTPLSLSPRSPRRSGCNSISASMSTSPATLRSSVSHARLKDANALSVIAAQDALIEGLVARCQHLEMLAARQRRELAKAARPRSAPVTARSKPKQVNVEENWQVLSRTRQKPSVLRLASHRRSCVRSTNIPYGLLPPAGGAGTVASPLGLRSDVCRRKVRGEPREPIGKQGTIPPVLRISSARVVQEICRVLSRSHAEMCAEGASTGMGSPGSPGDAPSARSGAASGSGAAGNTEAEQQEIEELAQNLAKMRLKTFQMENQLVQRLHDSHASVEQMKKELEYKRDVLLPQWREQLDAEYAEEDRLAAEKKQLEEDIAALKAKASHAEAAATEPQRAPCFRVSNVQLQGPCPGQDGYLVERPNRLLVATTLEEDYYFGYTFNQPSNSGWFRAADTRRFVKEQFARSERPE
eukprot:s1051_g3.t1